MRWMDDIDILPVHPLIGGRFLHPDAVTILYGRGGIGKGLIAAHTARQLALEGLRVGILDFEQREQEWVRRLIGCPKQMIGYEAFGEDILSERQHILQCVSDLHLRALIVDSAFQAQPDLLRGQADSASVRRMFKIMGGFGVPTLVIAHVPKGKNEVADHVSNPIGSVHWTTQARLTYSAIPVEIADATAVETRATKVNDRQRPEPLVWEFRGEEVRVRPRNAKFNVSREMWAFMQSYEKPVTAAMLSNELRARFPNMETSLSRVKLQNLLYRRDDLFRKVHTGWLSIDSARFFVDQQQVEGDP